MKKDTKSKTRSITTKDPSSPPSKSPPKQSTSNLNTSNTNNTNKKSSNSRQSKSLTKKELKSKNSKVTESKSSLLTDEKPDIAKQIRLRKLREKQNEKRDKELFEKILSESKCKNPNPSSNQNPLTTLKISEKKAQEILQNGGMLDAYKYLITQLCKNGLPSGNIFEYSAYIIQSYEKKWKEKCHKDTQEKVEKYWEEKTKDVKAKLGKCLKEKEEYEKGKEIDSKKIKQKEEEIRKLNRSLDERSMIQYIKGLDRSRSKRGNSNNVRNALRSELIGGGSVGKSKGKKNENKIVKLPPINTKNFSGKDKEKVIQKSGSGKDVNTSRSKGKNGKKK